MRIRSKLKQSTMVSLIATLFAFSAEAEVITYLKKADALKNNTAREVVHIYGTDGQRIQDKKPIIFEKQTKQKTRKNVNGNKKKKR